ncbi:hypothetical protein MRF4_20130 [Methylobacterium radiotolerans]|uniref:3-keto-5-aminohexanoate cleavage protein n=1 Tax=Methylobacterium oryzae TaxID=334852 RepID=A0ABU7TUD3_9HYPH
MVRSLTAKHEPATGELAASNEQLVARVVTIARIVGRDIASPAEARAILRL